MTTHQLGIYSEHGPAALDHDVAQRVEELLLGLDALDVGRPEALASLRRVLRGLR